MRITKSQLRKAIRRVLQESSEWDTPEELASSKCSLCAEIMWNAGFNMYDENQFECPQTGQIYTIVGPEQVEYYHPSGRTKTINASQLEDRINRYH